jgi:hypothetical protein
LVSRLKQAVEEEEEQTNLEYLDELRADQLDAIIHASLTDFDVKNLGNDEISVMAAQITRACITDQTRAGHARWAQLYVCDGITVCSQALSVHRIIKHYIVFHRRRDASWDPKSVTTKTPSDIRDFITKKCGRTEDGFEGKKVSYSNSCFSNLWHPFWHLN